MIILMKEDFQFNLEIGENSMSNVDLSNGSATTEAAILNTLMYLGIDRLDAIDNVWDMKLIVDEFENYYGETINIDNNTYILSKFSIDQAAFYNRQKQFLTVKNATENNAHLSSMVIGNQSKNLRYDKAGLNACTFTDASGNITVVFRGTGSGEWIDNGEALSGIAEVNTYHSYDHKGNIRASYMVTEYASDQQAQALNYFNQIAAKNEWTKKNNIIVTGHSKGGNKAQYITLNSDLVDECYSFNGQGFSPEALQSYKERYGKNYQYAVNKIYSFSAYNDYVNVLGDRAVPADHIYCFEAPLGDQSTEKYHFINAMLSMDGGFNKQTEQGELSKYLEMQSQEIMRMDPQYRQYVTRGIMDICQSLLGRGIPVNGDSVTEEDMYKGIWIVILPFIIDLLGTPQGNNTLELLAKTYGDDILSIIEAFYKQIGEEHGIMAETIAIIVTGYVIGYIAPILVTGVDTMIGVIWAINAIEKMDSFLA